LRSPAGIRRSWFATRRSPRYGWNIGTPHSTDVSAQDPGYDVESREPETGRLRLIEVKGRQADADTVIVTRNEMLVALNKRNDYYLTVVRTRAVAVEPLHYVQDPLGRIVSGDIVFGQVAVVFKLSELLALETAESPR